GQCLSLKFEGLDARPLRPSEAHRIHELTGDERILGAYLGGEESAAHPGRLLRILMKFVNKP
ncbi:MAG: hypothetical protein WBD97_03335, partial [Pseudolabrys sp.]